MKTVLSVLAFAMLVALAVSAHADDAENALTREAFAKYQAAKAEAIEMREKAVAEVRAAQTEAEKKAAREKAAATMKKAAAQELAARDTFIDAFAVTDWDSWGAEQDAALLESGLDETAMRMFRSNIKRSVKAWEKLIEKLPKCEAAKFARVVWLPLALASTGELDVAAARIERLIKEAPDNNKPELLMALGDTRAMAGNVEAAQAEYIKALKLMPGDADSGSEAGRARPGLELRIKMLGKAAPEIDSQTWLGADAKKLSALKGEVVILDFWATWSGACLESMAALDDLNQRYAGGGITVLGVTRVYDHGYVPTSDRELRSGQRDGKVVEDLNETNFVQHLWDFRQRTRVSYSFILGSQDDWQNFGVASLPTTFVLDKTGKVAFIAVGGMREHVLRITAERLLAAK